MSRHKVYDKGEKGFMLEIRVSKHLRAYRTEGPFDSLDDAKTRIQELQSKAAKSMKLSFPIYTAD